MLDHFFPFPELCGQYDIAVAFQNVPPVPVSRFSAARSSDPLSSEDALLADIAQGSCFLQYACPSVAELGQMGSGNPLLQFANQLVELP